MRRRRTRRRGTRSWRLVVVVTLFVSVGFLAGTGEVDSAAFDSGDASRNTAVNVTIDETGAHALDTAQAVHIDSTDPLVNVTNHLGRSVTVTVSLRNDSTHIGDLIVDGVDENDRASFSLGRDGTEAVDIRIANDSSLVGETTYFHVNATTSGLDVSATNRSTPVEG